MTVTGNPAESAVGGRRFLVLAHGGDTGALQVAAALEGRHGTGSVDLVSDTDLGRATWVHRQDEAGTTSRIDLEDGRTLTHDGYALVFNRLRSVFPDRFAAADEADRLYAGAETNALVLSWLASFACPVVSGPAPPALSPLLPSLPGLFAVAGWAGLPTRRFTFATNARDIPADGSRTYPGESPPPSEGVSADPTPRYVLGRDPALALEPVAGTPRRVLVVGDEVHGPVPDGLGPACVRSARESECDLLSLTFDRRTDPETSIGGAGTGDPGGTGGDWCLVGGDTHPELDDWADAMVVARYLERRALAARDDRGERMWTRPSGDQHRPNRTVGDHESEGPTPPDRDAGSRTARERRARNRALAGRDERSDYRRTS